MYLRSSILSLLLYGGTIASILAGGHDNLCVQTHFGHHGWEPLSNLKLIKELGVGWIRDDLYWGSVEKEKGKYKIPDYVWDWIKEAKRNDLKILMILNGGNRLYRDKYDREGYVNFAKFVAKEMKGYVQAIELINEPFNNFRNADKKISNAPTAWNGWNPKTGKTNEWVKKYLKTMNDMADAINEVAPGEYKIIGMGCSPPLNIRLLKLGVSKNIDGMALHPYSYRYVPELQPYGDTPAFLKRDGIVVGDKAGTFVSINKDLMETSAKYNGPKELWVTELGYTTYIPTRPRRYGGFTEEAQAKYAQRHFMECLGTGVRLVSWYTFNNRLDNPYHNLACFGIAYRDGRLKPAYTAIQRVARTMKNLKADNWGDVRVYFNKFRKDPYPLVWDGSMRQTFGSPRAYTFSSKDGKTRAVAVWSTERANSDLQPRAASITIKTDRKVDRITALDMMTGKKEDVKFVQKGKLIHISYLTVPDHPVMLFLDGIKPASNIKAVTDINIFNTSEGWKIHKAKGMKATWTAAQNIGILQYDGEGYAGAAKDLQIESKAKYISFKAKATEPVTILLRIYDKTGQTHQYKLSITPTNGWENFLVKLNGKSHSWGGAKDRKMHYPLTGIFFGMETFTNTPGALEFKNVQLMSI